MLRLLFLPFPFLLSAQQIPTSAFTVETTAGASTVQYSFDGDIATSWFGGWSQQVSKATITFDGVYQIDKIKYFDGAGRPTLGIYANAPGTGEKEIYLHQYQVWLTESCNIKARSITLELVGIEGDMPCPEIQFWGKKVGDTPQDTVVAPTPPATTKLTGVGSRINLCGFHWLPNQKISGIFTKKRDYQQSWWTWDRNGFSPQPLASAMSENVIGYDDYLTDAKEKGVDIIPAINQTPTWFIGAQERSDLSFVSDYDGLSVPYYNVKEGIDEHFGPAISMRSIERSANYHPDMLPRKPGSNPTDPASFIDWGKFFFQWGARYGVKTWPESMLHVNEVAPFPNFPHNEKKSGLNLLKYIEPGNESIKFWLPELGITPEEVAAMMSCVYDGHNGTLGPGVGLKGSGIKVVLPGLTSANLEEYKRMEKWCRENRPDGTLAWDIANYHWYSNIGNVAGRWPPLRWVEGTPADCDPAWSDVENFIKYVHSTGIEVWCTEFGYDSRPPSWQWAKPYGNYTSEQLQAIWLVRGYLMLFRAGVDQAFMFNGIDEPGAANGGLYQNSGLLYGRGAPVPYEPKPAYHAVADLAKNLNGYDYIGDASPSGKVMLMRFKKGNQYAAYVWMATVDGSTAQIKLDGKTITVTETPQFILMKPGRQISATPGPIRQFIRYKTVPRLKH